MKYKHILAAVAAVMLFAGQASAAVKTATMQLSLNNIATVNVSTSPINFGDVGLSTSFSSATGSITVNATSGAPYIISINNGLHSSVTSAPAACRTLLSVNNGQVFRTYQTYSDSAFSSRWGDSNTQNTCPGGGRPPSGLSLARTGTGSNQLNIVYAKAFGGGGGNSTSLGSLTDTLTVTVSY